MIQVGEHNGQPIMASQQDFENAHGATGGLMDAIASSVAWNGYPPQALDIALSFYQAERNRRFRDVGQIGITQAEATIARNLKRRARRIKAGQIFA